jgi:hypothetical protein
MVLSKFSVGMCQIISAAFLGVAIYKIRRMLSQSKRTQINVKVLLVHAILFGLYTISVVVYYIFYANYYWGPSTDFNRILDAWLFCGICGFIAQVCLCWIIWQFTNTKKPELLSKTKIAE